MKDYKLFKLLDKFRAVFIKAGIDYEVMKKILQVKFTMDSRSVPTVMNNQKDENSNSSAFKKSLITYGFTGFMIGFFMMVPFPMFYKMNIIIGTIIFMLMLTMISDFSSVLLDVKDKNILLPRPINERTISAAKIIHIFTYLSIINFCIAGPSLILGTIKEGLAFFLVFFFQVFFITGFVLILTSLLYYIVLKYFDGEKLKDVINYFQIVLSVFMIIAYQFMGRIYEIANLKLVYQNRLWHYLIPSMWFTGPYSMIFEKNYNYYNVVFALLSIAVPVIGFIIYFRAVVPYFEKNLQKLGNNVNRKNDRALIKIRRQRFIPSLIFRNETEKSFYIFTRNMISSERKLKLSLYPNLAIATVMPLILLMNSVSMKKSFHDNMTQIIASKNYFGMYITVMSLVLAFTYLCYSEKAKGAWIYKTLPIESPGHVFKGTMKAYIIRIVIPIFGLVSLVFLIIFKFSIISDIIVMFLSLLVILLLLFKVFIKQLPFSNEFKYVQGQNTGIVLSSIALSGAAAFLHFILSRKPNGIVIYIIVLAVSLIIIWNSVFRLSWDKYQNKS